MNIDYIFEVESNSWLITIDGEIDIYNAPQFKEKFIQILDERNASVILECSKLKYIDSTGLGVLISALKRVKNNNGTITIRGLKPYIYKIFTITGLDRIFSIEVAE